MNYIGKLAFALCFLAFHFGCVSDSVKGVVPIRTSSVLQKDSGSPEVVSLSIAFDPESNFGDVQVELELYENVPTDATPKTSSPVGFYREKIDSSSLFLYTQPKEFLGKLKLSGRRYLIPFYSKSFQKTILFGVTYLPEQKSFVQSRVSGGCVDSEEFLLCPKLFMNRKTTNLLIRKDFRWNRIDPEMTLRQWLVMALTFGITKYPVPLFGTVDFSEKLQVDRSESPL